MDLYRLTLPSKPTLQSVDIKAITMSLVFLGLVNQVHGRLVSRAPARGHGGTAVMSCRDTIHLICWYLEGRLSSPVANEIKRHVESCSDCHMVLNAAMSTLDRYFAPTKGSDEESAPQAA